MKKIRKLFLINGVMLFLVTQLSSQGPDTLWTRTYGGPRNDHCSSAQQTSDGGYIMVGKTDVDIPGLLDVYLIKTDANGDTIWTKRYGGEWFEQGNSVQQTSDDCYIIAGMYGDAWWTYNILLIKADTNGNKLWEKHFWIDYDWQHLAYSVQEVSDNGYVISGYYEGFEYGGVYLIKTNANGNSICKKTLKTGRGWSVKETFDGGFIIAGEDYGDVWLLKTDSNLDTLWTKTHGGSLDDDGYSVQETYDCGYIIAGRTKSFGAGDWDVYLIKTDPNGDTLWTKTYGGDGRDEGYSVHLTSDGGYIIAGLTASFGAGGEDVYLIRTDENGNVLWTKTYGGPEDDWACSVQETSDGGYMIAGCTKSFGAGLSDFYLIKTKPDVCIAEKELVSQSTFDLQISPNPFRNLVEIKLMIENRGCRIEDVSLNIYDVSGRIVKDFSLPTFYTLLPINLSWDGRDNAGKRVSAGIYFLRFKVGDYNSIRKILVMK